MAFTDFQTKQCLFCAETIQARAIKCRFCGEFLNSDKAKALEAGPEPDSQSSEDEETTDTDNVLFVARPSLWGMAPAMVKGLFFIVLAGLLVRLPLENFINDLLGLGLTESQSWTLAGTGLSPALGLA